MTILKECLKSRERCAHREVWEEELLATVFRNGDGSYYCMDKVPEVGAEYMQIAEISERDIFDRNVITPDGSVYRRMEILKKKGVKVVQVRVSEHENDSDVFRPALVR